MSNVHVRVSQCTKYNVSYSRIQAKKYRVQYSRAYSIYILPDLLQRRHHLFEICLVGIPDRKIFRCMFASANLGGPLSSVDIKLASSLATLAL